MTAPVVLFAALLALLAPVPATAEPAPVLDLTADWSYRRGDSPRDAAGRLAWLSEGPQAAGWVDESTYRDLQAARGGEFMWMRVRVPEVAWEDPVLYLPNVLVAFEVYVDGSLVHRFREFRDARDLRYSGVIAHLVPLPADVGGRLVSCRIYSPNPAFLGVNTRHAPTYVGDETAIIQRLTYENLDSVLLGSLFFAAGLIALGVFLRRIHHRLWYLGAFAWLSCTIGIFYMLSDTLATILGVPPPVVYYGSMVSFAAFPVGMYVFLERITGDHRVLRRLWQFHLAYLLTIVPLDLLDVVLIPVANTYYNLAFMLGIVVALVVLFRDLAHRSRQARLFGAGFAVFALTGLHDLLAGAGVIPLWHWLSHWGMLALLLVLSYILEQEYSRNLRRLAVYTRKLEEQSLALEEANVTLEERVEARTRELARKNDDLVATMQELQEAQQQMIVQDKMASLGNLVAGVAHELNTPIGAMVSAADVEARCIARIEEAIDGSAELGSLGDDGRFRRAVTHLKEANRLIADGGGRIARIVASLKSFARLDEADFQVTDLHRGLDSTLTLLQYELKHRIEVVRDYGDLPPVGCSADRINQVFMNLLMNAVQAIEGPGTITVTTRREGDEAVVRISDTGRGIAPEDLPRIFDPGFTTRGVGVGTGLGLAICFKIVSNHRGRIDVESETGRGAAFSVRLPLG